MPLSRRRLVWLVRARGTDLAAWPAGDRLAALALLRRCKDARQAFAEALCAEDVPEVDGAVLERMQCSLRRALAPLPILWRGLCVGVLVACAAAGLYLAPVAEADAANPDLFSGAQTFTVVALDQ